MKISQQRLRQIIAEEYIKEEELDENQAAEDLLRKIIGDEEYERRRALKNPDSRGGDTKSMEKPNKTAETTPFPDPDTAADSDVHPIKTAVDGIYKMVVDMDPEDVAEIFQIVFEKLPGVEMEKEPETQSLYSPGVEGRPQVGFKELKQFIRKVLSEGHYHDMGGEDEMYDALDPHGFDKMSDYELMDAMETDGMEDMIVRDGEGGLVNREEVIAALKNV